MRVAEREVGVDQILEAGVTVAEAEVADRVVVEPVVQGVAHGEIIGRERAIVAAPEPGVIHARVEDGDVGLPGLDRHAVHRLVVHVAEHGGGCVNVLEERNLLKHGLAARRRLAGAQRHVLKRRIAGLRRNADHRRAGPLASGSESR